MNIKLVLVFMVGIFISTIAFSQSSLKDSPPENWFNQDVTTQKINGVSTTKAYQLLKGKKSKTIVVAIIDSGIDIEHEDLKDAIWLNEDEIAGNGIDDDGNGYVDDINGWNFIGGKDGRNVGPDNFEITREYKRLKPIFEEKKSSKKADYLYWQEIEKGYLDGLNKAKSQRDYLVQLLGSVYRNNSLLSAYLDVDEITLELINTINSPDKIIIQAVNFMTNVLTLIEDTPLSDVIESWEEGYEHFNNQVDFGYNIDFDARGIIGDSTSNLAEVGYGNNDVIGLGTDNFHGTHVAGIIGAKRNNNIGIDGIADNVKIMVLRAVPDGDEYDKDVANAILYAVNNGAHIINMSFGKAYSPDKAYVDSAVKYAQENGVLLFHAAGNAGVNIDEELNFPTKKLDKKRRATNWLEIGASNWGKDNELAASFSNYSGKTVDLFAPGVEIYSTAPNNTYKAADGTSMASPVAAGVAALVWSYYPHLSFTDLKEILVQSSRKFDGLMVLKPGTSDKNVDFKELSISGGIINAFEAVKLAELRTIDSK